MRITIDLDTKNPFSLFLCISKGLILLRRLPVVRLSSRKRGFHLIWYGMDFDRDKALRYRWIIGDDRKRIYLDGICRKRITQILFTEKKILKVEGLNV